MLMRYWLVTPGWSVSWTALAKMLANTSKSVKTDWKNERIVMVMV